MKNFLFTSTVLAGLAFSLPALAVDVPKNTKSVTKTKAKSATKKAAPKPVAPMVEAKPMGSWVDGITFGGVIAGGGTWNTANPRDNSNFGRLIDSEDGLQLNQILLTAQRPIDPTSKDYDYGFKLQGLYGSDARISRTVGLLENATDDSLNQLDITEAHGLIHTPWFTDGGFDIKVGKYASPESAETIDASGNFFYSHSYIFNFGDPFYHTGVTTTLHVSPMIDLIAGIDTGVNTTIGGNGDNNDSLSYNFGIGINAGDVTSLLSSHIGPELADRAVVNGLIPANVNPDDSLRALNTLTTVWKVDDRWTLTNDLNWIYDSDIRSGKSANAFGVAQYATYKINDMFSVGTRGELYFDNNGAFVAQFTGNQDFIRGVKGEPLRSTRSVAGGKTTYGMITAGANITPDWKSDYLKGLRFRPEVRYDKAFSTRPFNDARDSHQLTFGMDAVLTF